VPASFVHSPAARLVDAAQTPIRDGCAQRQRCGQLGAAVVAFHTVALVTNHLGFAIPDDAVG
jgi:hypothetical protein